ncbi:MAG: divalent metal cation transporter [Bacillota bacterium]|nr:divalent metal cation transporter [Bacillota bacterium]
MRGRSMWRRILLFLAVMGPGIITGNVDNDAGGLTTYSVAGARYGTDLLWLLIPVTILLAMVQETSARMGAVTGKGLATLVREKFGLRTSVLALSLLFAGNFAVTVSNFAGVAAASEILGVSRYLSVPAVAFLVWLLVSRGSYRAIERVFLLLSLVYLTYVISGLLARPHWGTVMHALVVPRLYPEPGFLTLLIATIGTTITPWMPFYQQALVSDKGLTAGQVGYARLDTYLGAVMTDTVSFFIIVSCAVLLYPRGIMIETAAEAAAALAPVAGRYAALLFAVGLLNASAMGASVVPLSTAHAVAEGFGWESTVGRRFSQAPVFIGLYTALLILGAATVLVPGINLVHTMLLAQTVNGILLPLILILMLKLASDRRLMGRHANSRLSNTVSWAAAGLLIALTVVLLLSTIILP